ncbi:MAG: ethanolamine ammonia-lyase reactivating factor EutA [Candidatus Thorarchaeota archaeon]|jgi:ethanolamine utilization protein EutA
MTDANRLKWQIIDTVSEFFKDNFSDEADVLEDDFTKFFELLLVQHKKDSLDYIHLIKEFKPALSSVLQPGPHYDRLMGLVSPILNAALASAEQQKIQASLKEQESARRVSAPKTQVIPMYDKAENMKLLSVGIDIGSSTSHLVFSHLTFNRERSFTNPSNRFMLVDREVLYESEIIFTPLLDRFTIDVKAIVGFCKEEYRKAGYSPEDVQTGAVIVTGETAKKQNAEEIVKRLSSESGKFVSAVAGPNYESVLGAMGSGIVDLSGETNKTIMNVDIGGGTSNIAISTRGHVHSTSCINVGGRLLGIDEDFKIWRMDEPTKFVMKELGMDYKLGNIIPERDAKSIARAYAKALIEVMQGPAVSPIAKELMMTEDIDLSINVDQYSFSGGIAELFYGSEKTYDDIGGYLAQELKILADDYGMEFIEPETKIRATVIGAGAFTLSVSGSTCYFDKSLDFPITNIPVLPINVSTENYRSGILEEEVKRAFNKYDMKEGDGLVALYFKDSLYRSYSWLQEFVKSIENALPKTVSSKKMVILLFKSDIGKMVGLMTKRETSIHHNMISLDELCLEEGDWIDIGAPLHEGQVFPVTVKSLVFNKAKEYS